MIFHVWICYTAWCRASSITDARTALVLRFLYVFFENSFFFLLPEGMFNKLLKHHHFASKKKINKFVVLLLKGVGNNPERLDVDHLNLFVYQSIQN